MGKKNVMAMDSKKIPQSLFSKALRQLGWGKNSERLNFVEHSFESLCNLLVVNCKHTTSYCAFHKDANSEVQKPTDDCVFRCRQSS